MKILVPALLFLFICLVSCSPSARMRKEAGRILLQDSAILTGHIGIAIFEPAKGKYLFAHNSSRYFIPASNTKLFTLFAGLKYLGDSVPGINVVETADRLLLLPTGDPTLLHHGFSSQPVLNFISNSTKPIFYDPSNFKTEVFGKGWGWDDYTETYLSERSALPIFENNISFFGKKDSLVYFPKQAVSGSIKVDDSMPVPGFVNNVKRQYHNNDFILSFGGRSSRILKVPFITSQQLAFKILSDTAHKNISPLPETGNIKNSAKTYYTVFSRSTDSLFQPMMHWSDNFFAEQTLLMVSNKRFGFMDEKVLIDSLLRYDLNGLPQKPKWVDGSGLSRYNLFTPTDFIYLLNKLKDEFGWEKLIAMLPTGGEGTLTSYYEDITGSIFAKTGTLSNNLALSGYLITKKNKLLLFSIMVNNFMGNATPVRKAIEKFILEVRDME